MAMLRRYLKSHSGLPRGMGDDWSTAIAGPPPSYVGSSMQPYEPPSSPYGGIYNPNQPGYRMWNTWVPTMVTIPDEPGVQESPAYLSKSGPGQSFPYSGMKGLGDDYGIDPTGGALDTFWQTAGGDVSTPIPTYEAPIGAYTPATEALPTSIPGYVWDETSKTYQPLLTSGPSTSTALDAQNQAITNQLANSSSVDATLAASTAANKTLATLLSAGANAAQIAVARSNAAAAQAAYAKLVAGVAGTACASTIVSGMCNSTLYMVGGLMAALLVFSAMKK